MIKIVFHSFLVLAAFLSCLLFAKQSTASQALHRSLYFYGLLLDGMPLHWDFKCSTLSLAFFVWNL